MFWGKVLAAGVLLLGYSSALWRYRTNVNNYAIISTRTTIHLEYIGPDFIQWDIPKSCHTKNPKEKNTKISCDTQGIHSIRPLVKNQPPDAEERFIFVDRPSDCFMWYFQSSIKENQTTQNMKLWIYDPENASPSELAGNASEPSINSLSLSMQFFMMGQEPTILSSITYHAFFPQPTEQGIWEAQIPITKKNLFMIIKGNSVAFQDCFIADYLFLLSSVTLTFSQDPSYLPLTTNDENLVYFDWPPCFPSTAAAISHWEALFTKDAFSTSEKIRIPPNILREEERRNIEDIGLIEKGILFLTAGFVYLRTTDKFIKLDQKFGIPPNVKGLNTRNFCWPEFTPKEGLKLSELIIWTSKEIFLGYDDLKYKKILNLEEASNLLHIHKNMLKLVSINIVTYTSDPTGVALILSLRQAGGRKDMLFLVFYSEDTLKWTLQDFSMTFPHGSKLNALFMYSALPSFLLWDNKTVYYSYQNFTQSGSLKTFLGNNDLSAVAHNSIIHQVFIDYFGNGLIKMLNNIMFYFKFEVTDVAKLHKWSKESDHTIILINPTGDLCIVNLSYGTAEYSAYPLLLELYSSTFKDQPACPYILFETSIYLNNIYLDKRDELSFWIQVVYMENFGVEAIVDVYGPKVLQEKREVEFEVALGICTKNMTVTFYQGFDYEAISDYRTFQEEHMGHVMIQLRPSQFSKTCPLSTKVVHVFVGCFPKRHLKLQGYKDNICVHENFTYVIERNYLRGKPTEDKFINYNVSVLGCPFRIHMKHQFHPVIHLYDGNTFIEEVTVNYIIWEINGRTDFDYSLSMSDNYKHCFSFSVGKPGDLTQAYEIFNMTNGNKIIWKNHHVGVYVFKIKIIDPNYSFCDLTTTFAIETFGIIPETDSLLVLIYMCVMLFVIIVCLVLSYFQYLKFFRKFIYESTTELKTKRKRKYL
ncbi:cation channel sperm-associated auxiliary subunit epsilon-like isoform X2 [Macrotis lagotis]|uniref:cation channel sperm-associated auxiliary subunit epsilon-like isoform X2 n=1 Tax=Macrotis lagotis TaxID=92651 RepID=UPI003D6925B9